MQPLLNPDPKEQRDCVFVNRMESLDLSKIKRGDVIVFISPRDPSELLIKRVIGLQGDTIRTFKGNELVHIPSGHIWVEGDNHRVSYDSNDFGPISIGLTVAKATHILWPPRRISPIESAEAPGRISAPGLMS
ncbi:mitochondrial inner membrane protease subunit 2 [Galendromus occidentalis]|uniref:Mitochondrial inner membrane protease subunit 2 n=1 Tax=Galendromus occidentalis TaxID=34638 RepID=A0AAJ6VW47_9ACAR|nr:mitochondrial inner membrane protease subunit 2 [Galendromus occidentalis]